MNLTHMVARGALALITAFACGAHAAEAEGTPRLKPLPAADYAAIMAEAKLRAKGAASLDAPWKTLKRDQLARLLDMPEFAAEASVGKSILIDQAGAWDLFTVDRPSHAQEVWARLLPEKENDLPVAETDTRAKDLYVYYADNRWGKQSRAQIALINCMPAAAWRVKHMDPMVWAMENEEAWRTGYGDNFGDCVRSRDRETATDAEGARYTAHGLVSASILEEGLSNFLLANKCTGSGPDSCLPLLHALNSLSPRHPKLARIVKLLEADFALDRAIAQSEPDEVRSTVLRRQLFLAVKMPVLLVHPEAWPQGELERTFATAMALDAALADESGHNKKHKSKKSMRRAGALAQEWTALPSPLLPEAAVILARMGRERAGIAGCDEAERMSKHMPSSFWISFAEAKLEREQTFCKVPYDVIGAAALYAQARSPSELAPMNGLRRFLDTPGAAHDAVLGMFRSRCDSGTQGDFWMICRELTAEREKQAQEFRLAQEAQAAAQAAEEARQRALAEQQRIASQECGKAEFGIAAVFLKKPKLLPRSEENTIVDDSACKPWPGKEPYTLAVFTYNGKDEYEKPMLIALLDVGHGKVVASLKSVFMKDASIAYSNALHFDTARYQLQPGLRAFAIDVATRSPRYAEGGFGPIRTLYVREGAKIRQVSNDIWMGEWHQVEDETPKPVNADEDRPDREVVSTTYTIGIAKTVSHGYADLLITGKSSDPKEGTTTKLIQYDGKTYPLMQP